MEIGPRQLTWTLSYEEAFEMPPPRRTLWPVCEECLEYAAGQFWVSFTCRGCLLEAFIRMGKLKELPPPETEGRRIDWETESSTQSIAGGFVAHPESP